MEFTITKTIDVDVERLVEIIEDSFEDYLITVCDFDSEEEIEQIDVGKIMIAVGGCLEELGRARQKER